MLRNSSLFLIGSVVASFALAACTESDADDIGSAGAAGIAGRGEAGAGEAGSPSEAGAGGEAGALGSAGPDDASFNEFHHPVGTDPDHGREVFRLETFGNEGYWTRVLRLPQGLLATGFTTAKALELGVNIDIDAVPTALRAKLTAEAKTDLSPDKAPLLNDPATFMALVEANAVVGLPARNVTALDGVLDIDDADVYAKESMGMSCALCHSITDGSVYSTPHGGGIGKRNDGRANHDLNFGALVALGEGTRSYYPTLAVDLEANKHQSVSRKGVGVGLISKAATEEEVDAFLNDPELYPVGMFDDAVDGNAAPMHNSALFRTDLAAPWGSDGSIAQLQNFSNLVYTALLDPTDMVTEGGRRFLSERGGAAGLELADNYAAILADMGIPAGGINGYPFVGRADKTDVTVGLPAGAKIEDHLIGIRVDDAALFDMNAYLNKAPAPEGAEVDAAASARGRALFRTQCTSCHNEDQSRFVPTNIVPYNDSVEFFDNAPARPALFPDYSGKIVASRATARLAPVRNSGGIFDDKLVIVEASNRNQPRGSALPLLLDLDRKPTFLHDDSAGSLEELLDPARGAGAPHPFYLDDAEQRADMAAFLTSLTAANAR